ncbi:MAG: cadherin domain-containing protein [Pseudomonadales bacterium]|nr:cadherin domain-containing protein [Pseudomonadales bacterium]
MRVHRRTDRGLKLLFAALLLFALGSGAAAAPAGTVISNTAFADFLLGGTPVRVADGVDFTVEEAPGGGVPPVAIGLDGTVVPAGVAGATIGLVTLDGDAPERFTLRVDDARFEIVDGILRLGPGVSLAATDGDALAVTITAVDSEGRETSRIFVLTVEARIVPSAPLACVAPDLRNGAAIAVAEFSLCENAGGAAVAQLVSPPEGTILTVDDARFTIDAGGLLRLRAEAAVDFEAEPVIALTLTVTEGGEVVDVRTLAVTIGDRNEAPALQVAPIFRVMEGVAAGALGPVGVSDPDVGDAFELTVEDARFEIVAGELRLRDGATLTREDGPEIRLVLKAADAGGLVATETVVLQIVALNRAPSAEDDAVGVALASPPGAFVTRVRASDEDPGDTLGYTLLGGNEAGAFALDAEGAITVADPSALGADGEVFELRIRVTDDNSAADPVGELATDVTIRITVTDANTPPVVEDGSFAQLDEHSPAGTIVGRVEAIDVHDDPLTWRITAGDPAGVFEIDPVLGDVRVARPELLDFETRQSFALEVSVTDSFEVPLTSVASVEVPLRDVNEAPVIEPASFTLPRNVPLGAFVGDVRFSDPDVIAGDRARISIVAGNEAGAFEIDPITGTIKVTNLERLGDRETVSLRVRATDGNAPDSPSGPLSSEGVVTITLGRTNRAPTAIDLDDLLVDADSPGAEVGRLSTTDPDVDDAHRYSLSDPRFVVESGVLRLADGVALAPGETVRLQITAIDPLGLSVTRTFQVGTVPIVRNPAVIDFLKSPLGLQREQGISLSPTSTPGLSAFDLRQPQCSTTASFSGPFVDTPTPRSLGNFALPVPGSVSLQEASLYKVGEPLFVRVRDIDPNRDPLVRDEVVITLSVDASQDVEILRLVETGPDTSEFMGYVQSTSRANEDFDCALWVSDAVTIIASYFDPEDGTDTAAAAAFVDPFGVVFDSATGRRIDDALVRLVDVDSGAPAEVFGDEPFAVYPSELRSGGTVRDEAGVVYDFGPGEYRFPLVNPGNYRLEVVPPNRFRFPSAATDAALAALPDGPYVIDVGSRGEAFPVPIGPAVRIDLPLDLAPLEPTPASVELFALAPAGQGEALTISATQCADGTSAALPRDAAGGVLALPAALALVPAEVIGSGDDVYLRLTDPDEDRDPFAADVLEVELSVDGAGEVERIRLTETGASTGVFSGHFPTFAGAASPGDCRLDVGTNARVRARYVDVDDVDDVAVDALVVDPASVVFDAGTGAAVDGVVVTLLEAGSGAPASPLFPDGVTPFPATVVSGETVLGPGGLEIDPGPGGFRFPLVPPGEYRLSLEPVEGLVFPSLAADDALQGLPGAPFLLGPGSRGEVFVVGADEELIVDVPLDPAAAELFLSKQARSDIVAIGDFLQYAITLQNAVGAAAGDVTLLDTLPVGFRYQPGSLRLDGEPLETVRVDGDGRTLRIDITDVGVGASLALRYVVEVTAGAELGEAINRVTAVGPRVASANTAEASVVVREDLLRSEAILVGRVYEGGCEVPAAERRGMAGVRIFLEDGTNVVTDASGRWHLEGVEPGTHVVQLDLESLPASHRVLNCEDNTRFAGTPFSKFVDVQGGSLWRADFHVALNAPVEEEITTRLQASLEGDRAVFSLEAEGRAVPLSDLVLVAMLPAGLEFVPGSVRRGDRAAEDPPGAGSAALTFRLGDQSGEWREQLTFHARVTDALPEGPSEVKAVAMFGTPSERRVRSALATAELDVARPPMLPAGKGVPVMLDAPGARERFERMLAYAAAGEVGFSVEVDGEPPAWLVSLALERDVELRVASGATSVDGTTPASTPTAAIHLVPSEAMARRRQVAPSRADSGVVRTRAVGEVAGLQDDREPYRGRELPSQLPPDYTADDVGTAADGPAVLFPAPGQLPRITSTWFVLRHGLNDKVDLRLNGEPVSPLNFDGRRKFEAGGVALSTWRGVDIEEGRNVFLATVTQADGVVRTLVHDVYFSGPPVHGEYVPEASRLVADGVNPPEIAIRLFDSTGSPVRPGMTGEFTVDAPYAPFDQRREEVNISENLPAQRTSYVVYEDGIAYIPLEPTTRSGEVRLTFDFGPRRGTEEFFARLLPAQRDWIVVGFGEGTVGYGTLSDNMIAAREAGNDSGTRTDGRVSLFAKGMIQGKYLLTLAYDTDKRDTGRFGQQVDPNRFYTLYGDGSQQQFEAASQEKLYLRIERDAFSALFGDVDTRLGEGELTRFSRRLTGVRTEWADQDWELALFGAETETAFVRDEIRGDGTSGLYRLSGERILQNSERLRIETRDRFDDAVIVETRSLTRFVDYNIDYDAGTVLFRAPVQAQDFDLNPTFIVAEYETEGDGDGRTDVVAGGRVARRLEQAELGASFVHDGTRGAEASLGGFDARWRPDAVTDVRAEAAWSRGKGGEGSAKKGGAWLIEAERRGEVLTGRGYYREQQQDFGVGQQSVSQGGTRRFGVEMELRMGNASTIQSEAYQQKNLESGALRKVLELESRWQREALQFGVGLRSAAEESADGEERRTDQLTARAQQALLDGRLRLGATGEQAIQNNDSRDFPARVGLSAEFQALSRLTLVGTQELSFAEDRDTQDTFFGARAEPWNGAQVDTGVTQRLGENAERTFATVGLTQAFQLSESLSVDFGFNREQTLEDAVLPPSGQSLPSDRDSDGDDADLLVQDPNGAFPARPPASGAAPGSDFTSGFLGAAWRRERWEATGRLEHREGDEGDRSNLRLGFARQLDEGRIYSVVANLLVDDGANEDSYGGDLRFALAWRPHAGAWTFLDRLDLVASERTGAGLEIAERKLVNNFAANYKPNARNQLALLFGAKYVLTEIDGQSYSSVNTLLGSEYRHDVTNRWDLGLHGSVLSTWAATVHDVHAGVSVGHTPFDNFWVSVGYNFVGFRDDDFTAADYTARGPFLKFRFKLDQHSLSEYLGELPFGLD